MRRSSKYRTGKQIDFYCGTEQAGRSSMQIYLWLKILFMRTESVKTASGAFFLRLRFKSNSTPSNNSVKSHILLLSPSEQARRGTCGETVAEVSVIQGSTVTLGLAQAACPTCRISPPHTPHTKSNHQWLFDVFSPALLGPSTAGACGGTSME